MLAWHPLVRPALCRMDELRVGVRVLGQLFSVPHCAFSVLFVGERSCYLVYGKLGVPVREVLAESE